MNQDIESEETIMRIIVDNAALNGQVASMTKELDAEVKVL
jgi:hypothetical protein